jgi:hypothetical protein
MEKYFKENNDWYYHDKNGTKKKVGNKYTLEKLNNSIDTTQEEDNTEKPITGVGDAIEKIANFLKLKKCEHCEQRRKDLNKIFPFLNYDENVKLTEEEEETLAKAKESPIVPFETAKAIFDMYNKYFSSKRPQKFCQCGGLFKRLLERLTLLSQRD